MGRAKGGFLIGVKKTWVNNEKVQNKSLTDNMVQTIISSGRGKGKEKINIISIYNTGNLRENLKELENMSIETESKLIIGGDFNIRIGELGVCLREEGDQVGRCSKDKVISNEGKYFIDLIEEKGWSIMNGCMTGDPEGEFTYVGARGHSVIDYAITNDRMWDEIQSFTIGERVESDHMPIILETLLKKENCKEIRKNWAKGKIREICTWSEEDIAGYRAKVAEILLNKGTELSLEETWVNLKSAIELSCKKKVIKVKKWRLGQKRWWDRECGNKKRKVKAAFVKWKKGKVSKGIYTSERKNWRQLCREKELDFNEKEEAAIRSIKRESEVWKFLGRKKKKEQPKSNISLGEWKEHFMNLLGGTNEVAKGPERTVESEEKKENMVTREEIIKAIYSLKKKKAPGFDKIVNEAWLHGGEAVVDEIENIIKRVWSGEGMIEDWKIAVVVPLFKKGDINMASNYRGISLLSTAYKIYTEILRQRLEIEMNEKDILPEGQAGFRKGRSTIDNIYI